MSDPFIEVIYTIEGHEQEFAHYTYKEKHFESRAIFFKFLAKKLGKKKRLALVKLSCCVYYAKDLILPDWYHDNNGKYYLAEIIELLKSEFELETSVDPDTIRMLTT